MAGVRPAKVSLEGTLPDSVGATQLDQFDQASLQPK